MECKRRFKLDLTPKPPLVWNRPSFLWEKLKYNDLKREARSRTRDFIAEKMSSEALFHSKIQPPPIIAHYFPNVSPCSMYLPSQCPNVSHQLSQIEDFHKRVMEKHEFPTVERVRKITDFFPDSIDDAELVPCSKPLVHCAARDYVNAFTVDDATDMIKNFIEAWKLPVDWKFSVSFFKRMESVHSSIFKYCAYFSKPKLWKPVPEAVARVYLTLTLSKLSTKHLHSTRISYQVEGNNEVYTSERLNPLWLESVVETKLSLRKYAESLVKSQVIEATKYEFPEDELCEISETSDVTETNI